mgnify:CR=1 FL=1
MKRMSLQWRLTCITTLCIAIICGCLTMFVYKNGVHYIDSLQDAVESQGDEKGNKSDEIYISIPDDKWDEFADEFSVQVYNNKADYKRNSLIITVLLALLGGVVTYFISGHALRPIREFSDKIEEVQAQNLSEPLEVPLSEDEISRLTRSFNDMLARLDNAFSAQKQFVASAAHELRTPLAVMQTNLEVFYKKPEHAPQEYDRLFTMLQEQTGRLSHLAEILLDMTGLQTVERSDTISLAALTEEVFCDLDPVAEKHQIRLIQTEGDCTVTGSYILLYRAVYNLVENAIKYNRPSGSVTVSIHSAESAVLEVTDTGIGISPENQEKIFDPFYRVDKSRSRAMGGAGLGLALVSEIARQHNGQVKVTQSSEKGSTIALILPKSTDY